MKPNNFVFNLLQGIFTIVGLVLITIGYFSAPGSTTDDGYPLNTFLYSLGGFFIVWPVVLFGVIRYFFKRAAARRAWLVENGIKGKARVLNMRGTHIYINKVPQMAMDLQITTSLGERYETTHKTVVPMQYYNIIRPDADLPVYIDPNNKNKLFIDFQQAWMEIARKILRSKLLSMRGGCLYTIKYFTYLRQKIRYHQHVMQHAIHEKPASYYSFVVYLCLQKETTRLPDKTI